MDFSKRYDRDEFMKFLQNEFLPEDVSFTTDPEAEKQEKTKYIKAITKLGTCPSLRLAVYEARHTSPNDARVGLSKEIFRFMGNKRERRALVLFVPEGNGANYRFSLISIDLHETEDGKIQHGYSNPRRYSYYLGEGVAHRTPDDYLKKRSRVKDADDLTSRFAVEILNKAFFDEYKDQYRKFCKFLNENPEMRRSFQDFSDDGKAIRDYVKKMLGRIVFLYFVQRKGWLDGNYRYMSDLFAHAAADVQSDFLDRVLEPMFFGLLNTPKAERIAHAEKNGWDFSLIPGWENIPYLNGGLFEQDEIDKCKSVFPKEYFAALFDFFDTYNFTIDENDPDDSEVGIDPEMLGHIFENLLEDNKDKGAFYTPKEIVQYMCRESVIQYLKTREPDARYAEAIEHLIRNGEVDKELQDKAVAMQFTKWLSEVKVCDPAIGSGAFPMGVLNVLYHSRRLLYGFTMENTAFSPAEVKREIIQNNIYGVDIEQGAVDIARLRFWLSLVVDEDRPQPLPNLDYKIMQGNSLLESFMGYDLSRLLPVNKDGKTSKRAIQPASANDTQARLVFGQEQNSIAEIQRLMRLYYSPENHEQKEQLKQQIDTLVKEHIVICSGNKPAVCEAVDRIADNNKPFFLWHLYFADVFQKGGFDIVIGNPPYIKEGRMSKAYFLPYKNSPYYKGKMDIWYMFGCKGLDLLNKNGILCFIATNNWVTSFGAGILRNKIMKETRICNLVDFGPVMMFDSASIQTMIMLFQKDNKTNDYAFDYRRLTKYKATEKDAIAMLTKSSKDAEYFYPTIRRGNYIDKNFTFSRSSDVLEHIKQHNNAIFLTSKEIAQGIVFPQDTLNHKNQIALGNHFKEGEGIFVLKQCEKEALQLNLKELSLVKPYYTSSNINRYFMSSNNSLWTIYTDSSYKNSNSLNEYPHIKAHLDKYLSIFTSDNKPYGLHRAREERFFKDNKILAMRKSVPRPVFAYCDFPCYVSQTFNMIQTERVNMKYLTGLLNSTLIEFWLKNKGKMQGTNYQLDKEPLQEIPIVVPTADVQNIVATLVDIIILLRSNLSKRASNLVSNEYLATEYEKLIDGCVYELYLKEEMDKIGVSVIPSLSKYMQCKELNTDNMQNIWNIYKMVDDNGLIDLIDSLPLLNSEMLKTIILS